jgi:hypothetical protein
MARTEFCWSYAEADFIAHRVDGANHILIHVPQLMTAEVVEGIIERAVEVMSTFQKGSEQWQH